MSGVVETPFRTGHAAESAHWYQPDGSAAYEVLGKNGKWRATTLRDARTSGLVPSVTSIIRVAAAPGLEKWKQEQVLLACLTSPMLDDYRAGKVDEKSFLAHVYETSKEQAAKAAELGTTIHAAIERHFLGEIVEDPWAKTALACEYALEHIAPREAWMAERSFASKRYGFGGKIDLMLVEDDRRVVVDFKGKSWPAGRPPSEDDLMWSEQCMQLAAYDCGTAETNEPSAMLVNVFFNRENPGEVVRCTAWPLERAKREWEKFLSLLRYWQHDKQLFCGAVEL